MTRYSIVDELDDATVAGEIAALQAYSRKATLVVEGSSDLKFFHQFVDHTNCWIVPANGWENAINGLMIVRDRGLQGVLLVLDLDYRALLGEVVQDPDIVFTEEHDIEIAMVSSVAFDKVLHELGAHAKIQVFGGDSVAVRDLIYAAVRPIGALRLYAQERSILLDFDGYDYRDIPLSMILDTPNMIRTIFARSKLSQATAPDVETYIADKIGAVPDHHLCCGHDVCASFGKSLQSKLGSQNARWVSGEVIERNLRLAYGEAEFVSSHLYREIKAWENLNAPFRILVV